jgi:hypothetical protein
MPLPYGQKFPPMKGWSENNALRPEIKAANENTIRRWWEGEYKGGNIALCCGPDSGVFILDIDGEEAEAAIKGKEIPAGPQVKTAHGRHIYFRYPASLVIPPKVGLKEKMDIRGRGAYALLPPSLHPDGVFYEWGKGTEELEIPEAPFWLLEWIAEASPRRKEEAQTKGKQRRVPSGDTIAEGERNHVLTQTAGRLRWAGLDEGAIEKELRVINQRRCNPPLPEQEVSDIARSIGRYPKGNIESKSHDEKPGLSSEEIEELLAGLENPEEEYLAFLESEVGEQENGQSLGYAFNDSGNAQRLLDVWGEGMFFCPFGAGWVIWNGDRWEGDAIHKAISNACSVSRMLYAQVEGMTGIEEAADNDQKEAPLKQEGQSEE